MKISHWGLVLREDLGEIFMQIEMRAGNDARGCGWSAHVGNFNKIYPQALLVPKYYQRQCADVAKSAFSRTRVQMLSKFATANKKGGEHLKWGRI